MSPITRSCTSAGRRFSRAMRKGSPNAVLAPGASVLAVDRRFLDGCEVVAESEQISVPRYFRSPSMAPREVDFLYSEIPLLDLKLD